MKTNKCLFCQNESFTKILAPPTSFNDNIYSYIQCNTCSLVQISPLLTEDDYNKLYTVDYHQEFYSNEKDYSDKIRLIKKYAKGKKLLDYGCGNGMLVKNIAENGFHAFGLDYDPKLIEQLNATILNATFYVVNEFWETEKGKYDIIHLGDVLEHLTNPIELTTKLKNLLSENGILIVDGPLEYNLNIAFFSRQLLTWAKSKIKPNLVADHKPYHVLFSNYRNQIAFFKDLGYEELYFKAYEKAWPYTGRFKNIKTPKDAIQYIIFRVSIFVSFFIPTWGNRFIYIGRL